MKRALAWFAVAAILLAGSAYFGENSLKQNQWLVAQQLRKARLHQSDSQGDSQDESHDSSTRGAQTASPEVQTANQLVVVDGPLANWTRDANPNKQEGPVQQENATEERLSYKPNPNDHIVHSDLTSKRVTLHQTLAVVTDKNVAFEIPAHVVSPHLHGKYRSSLGQRAGDASACVDFFLMNEEQYDELRDGHPAVGLFSAEASHGQTVNFDLPPSMNQPMKYYLVFRNSGKTETLVETDFVIDF